MAKFTKTTEVDISAMHDVMEEEIPKKNKWGIIVPIVLSVLIAFGIWIYATNVSSDTHSKTFDVAVQNASGETVEIEVKGTYSQLADMKSEYIIVKKIVEENGDVSYSTPKLQTDKDGLTNVVLTFAD